MSHTELNRKLSILIERNVIDKVVDEENTYYSLLSFGKRFSTYFLPFRRFRREVFSTFLRSRRMSSIITNKELFIWQNI